MPKHSVRQFTTARLILSFAAAILVALVGWVAFRAGGPAAADDKPVIVEPPSALQAVESALVTPSPSVSSSPSASPSAGSVSPSTSASRKPQKSRSPSPSKTSKAPASPSPSRTSSSPAAVLQATYSASASWHDGFTANVRIVNNGTEARDFTVTITYPSGTDLRIRGDWNASARADGSSVTLRGGTIAPGASVNAGFQAAKDDDDNARASGCTVVGGTCAVS